MPATGSRWVFGAVMVILLTMPRGTVAQSVSFEVGEGRLAISVAGTPVADYVWEDAHISRPYFAGLRAPNGQTVTRTHPPHPERDAGNDDHATFHPGVWLAFGDLAGADFWRNRAAVRHVRFLAEPVGGESSGSFSVVNRYETLDAPPRLIAMEETRYTFRVTEHGYLLECAVQFTPAEDTAAFGDQEEMGFGIRLATAISVKHGGGALLNSAGDRNEAGTWGQSARWCAGMAVIDGVQVGAVILPSPDNFRPSWFHARDYGLIVANPFGGKSMTGPDDPNRLPDHTPAKEMRLGFAVGLFSTPGDPVDTIEGLYQSYAEDR